MKRKLLVSIMLTIYLCLSACSPQNTSSDLSSDSLTNGAYTESGEQSASSGDAHDVEQEKGPFSIESSPFFDISFDKIEKIYFYDASMGEEQTVSSSQTIEKIAEQWELIQFYNEAPVEDPTKEGLSRECLYYFEFYESIDSTVPLFCAGFDPFYIKVGEEKFGPYKLKSDKPITEILNVIN